MAINRRSFLKKTGWVAAGVTVTAVVSYPAVRAALPALPTFADPALEDGLAWVQALPTGNIAFFCPRMEMGQGATLGLSQVVAEELNVSQSQVTCILPDTDQSAPFKMTVGSESISSFFDPVSFGAARLREALRGLAAVSAGLAPDQITDGRGGFVLPDGTTLSYGAIVPSEPLLLTTKDQPDAAQLPRYAVSRRGNFQAIGQAWKHPELEAIVTGQAVYSRDVTVPGMVYGQVVHPPVFGARLQSVDLRAAQVLPGVVTVVDRQADFVGVVTDDPFALPQAVEAVTARWEMPDGINQDTIDARLDVEALRAANDFEHELAAAGDISAGRRSAQHQVGARYDTSFAAHAAMEPRAGVAWVRKDKVEIWCGSQDPYYVQKRVAKITGHASDDVVVHTHRMGGGFGGRIVCQASEEAARLSAAVGRPVRVQWDRETEFQSNYFQPAYAHFINAGVAADGTISHWEHDLVSSPIIFGSLPETVGWALNKVKVDFGTVRGSAPPYRLANQRIRFSNILTNVPTGAWRGLGAAPNAFAIESMIDELAATAKIDAIAFRLHNLPEEGERLAQVLRRVADIANWGQPVEADTGRGVACAVYKGETAVAVVVEVRVDHAAAKVLVTKAWCAQDCGLVVNPNQVESLVMGNIIWGCGMALKEKITIDDGAVEESNFDAYQILRHHEAPEIVVSLVGSDAAPVGVGEPAIAPVAAAVANAVFAATGRRVRRLPMSYESVFSDA